MLAAMAGSTPGGAVTTTAPASGWCRQLVHAATRLEPGRPAWAVGIRMGCILAVPLVVGFATGRVAQSTIVCLGALNGGMADTGGAPATRRRALTAAAVCNAAAFAAGTLAGLHLAVAVPAMFAVAVVCAAANLYGNVAANIGFTSVVLFMVGLGLPGGGSVALQRWWLTLVGGAWTLVVTLAVWPVHPFDAARTAVAGALRSVASVVGVLVGRADDRPGLEPVSASLAADRARDALGEARTVLTATREGRRGHSATGTLLLRTVEGATRVLVAAEELVTSLERAREVPGAAPAVASVARILEDVGNALVATGDRIERSEEARPGPGGTTDDRLEAVDGFLVEGLAAGGYDTVAAVRPLAEGVHRLVASVALLGEVRLDDRPSDPGGDRDADDPTRHLGRRAADVWATARQNATLSSAVFRHALRFGIVSAAGATFTLSLHLEKGYWVLISIAVILRPYAATTLQRSVLRVGGTVVGAALAAVVAVVADRPAELVAAVLVLTLLTFALLPVNYGLGVIFLTPMVIVLITAGAPGDWHLAGARIVDTLLGAALALAGGWALWPRSERVDLTGQLADAVGADRRLLATALGTPVALGPGEPTPHERAGLAVSNAQAGFQRLLADPVGRRGPTDALWSLTEAVRDVYLAGSSLEGIPPPEGVAGPTARVADVATALDAALAEVAAALSERRRPEPSSVGLGALDRAVTGLTEEAVGLRSRGRRELEASPDHRPTAATLASRRLWRYATVCSRLAALVGELDRGTAALAGAGDLPGGRP
jgi:uncharacterized membrane protein YccC